MDMPEMIDMHMVRSRRERGQISEYFYSVNLGMEPPIESLIEHSYANLVGRLG